LRLRFASAKSRARLLKPAAGTTNSRCLKGGKNYTKTAPIQFEEFAPCISWWKKREETPVRYLTLAHVQRDRILTDNPRFFEVTPEEFERWRLLPGDLLIGVPAIRLPTVCESVKRCSDTTGRRIIVSPNPSIPAPITSAAGASFGPIVPLQQQEIDTDERARHRCRSPSESGPITEVRSPGGEAPCGRMLGYEHSRLGYRARRSEHLQMSPRRSLAPPWR
jgi:hypothetical protein